MAAPASNLTPVMLPHTQALPVKSVNSLVSSVLNNLSLSTSGGWECETENRYDVKKMDKGFW